MYFSPEVGTKEFSKFIVCFNDTTGGFTYIESDVNRILDIIFMTDSVRDGVDDLQDITVYLFWCRKEILKFDKGDKRAKYKQVAIRDKDGWKKPENEIFAELTLLDSGRFFKVFDYE